MPPAYVRGVREATRVERRQIELDDPRLQVDVDQQARHRVGEGLDEPRFGAELRVQASVLDRDAGGCGDAVDELSGFVERRIVHDCRHGQPCPLDVGHRALGRRRRLADVVPLRVYPLGRSRAPVDDVHGRVAEDICEGIAKGNATLECEHQVRGRGAGELRPEDADEERDRDRGEGREEDR